MAWVSPRTWTTAEVVTAAFMNQLRDSLKAIGDPWTAYTPSWGSSGTAPAIGNGTIDGAWISAGKLVHFRAVITMGTTTTYGTGTYTIGLPATVGGAGRVLVAGIARDDSAAADFPAAAIIAAAATTAPLRTWPTSAAGAALIGLTNAIPFTWANLDSVTISGTYEAS
jgi:hypothetical protein